MRRGKTLTHNSARQWIERKAAVKLRQPTGGHTAKFRLVPEADVGKRVLPATDLHREF
jgi:hypothetical protein